MNYWPFLPGLILALAVWIIPFLFRILPANIFQPTAARYPWISALAPWIHSLGLPYLGLLLGWISSRDYGLTGQTLAEWGFAAAAAVLLGFLLAWVSARFMDPRGGEDVRAEARWCLYRAAAWPWVNYLSIAVAVGLIAALAEYALKGSPERTRLSLPAAVPFLVRTVGSGALFLLAHNFYLAMVYYLIAFVASKPGFQTWIGSKRASIANNIPGQRRK
jgi:hypothetical protein